MKDLEKIAEALEKVADAMEFLLQRTEQLEAVLRALTSGTPVGINDEGYLIPWSH